jgi:hypothetical protein
MNEKMAAVAGLAAGGGRGRASGESGSVAREVQAANKEIKEVTSVLKECLGHVELQLDTQRQLNQAIDIVLSTHPPPQSNRT